MFFFLVLLDMIVRHICACIPVKNRINARIVISVLRLAANWHNINERIRAKSRLYATFAIRHAPRPPIWKSIRKSMQKCQSKNYCNCGRLSAPRHNRKYNIRLSSALKLTNFCIAAMMLYFHRWLRWPEMMVSLTLKIAVTLCTNSRQVLLLRLRVMESACWRQQVDHNDGVRHFGWICVRHS